MNDPKTPAEQITGLLAQLNDEVRTEESILRYRTVRRGRRNAAIADFVIHRTRLPGLMTQARAAAVPQGSAGWDADGALSPIGTSGSFESQEPVTDAFHLPEEYANVLLFLAKDARDAGYGTLVEAALADEQLGKRIVARLRAVVHHARIVLHYDAPVVPLRDMYCVHCGGSLHVRADASSAVWCAAVLPVHGPAVSEDGAWPIGHQRCGANWPQGSWVKLLEAATEGEMMGS